MFRDVLRDLVQGVDGGLAGMVMDFEGIPLESFSLDKSTPDIESVGIEASVLVKSIRRATEMLEAGKTDEVSVRTERLVTLIRVLNDRYFVAMTLKPSGNLGKARYLLRTAGPGLVEALE